jgi:hypothetical protein
MIQCLEDLGGGAYQIANPQPTDYTTCTYVLVQPSDLQSELWNISIDDGIQIGFLLGLVLLAGFTFRAMARALNSDERYENESS